MNQKWHIYGISNRIRRDTLTHLETGREDPQPYHVRLEAGVLDVPHLELVS